MEATWIAKGGRNSRKNMDKKTASDMAARAAREAWKGHIKDKSCVCPHCSKRKHE